MNKVAVASRSFSKHPILRKAIIDRYPNVKFNDKGVSLSGESLVEFLTGCNKAIIALEEINEPILKQLPDLKVVGKYGVGLDTLDLEAMEKYGIKLGWKGGINKRSVSELVIAFATMLLHRAIFANSETRKGKWYQVKGRQLSECTVGVIGCGHIGKDLIRLLQPYKCNILVHDIVNDEDFNCKYKIQSLELEDLLRKSDVITLHLPLDESTRDIINKKRLKLIKPSAVLINLARGGLVDERALRDMIAANDIAGVALDVFEVEPPIDSSFSIMDNVLITPHIGGSTEEAVIAMGMAAIEGLERSQSPMKYA